MPTRCKFNLIKLQNLEAQENFGHDPQLDELKNV